MLFCVMSKKNVDWQCYCETEEIYLGLANLAKDNGWPLAGEDTITPGFGWKWLSWKKNNREEHRFFGSSRIDAFSSGITIDETVRRLKAGPPKDDRIFVEAEKATIKLEILQEFMEALTCCEVGSFAVRHGWRDVYGSIDSYYRQIAQLVLKRIDG